MNECRHNKALYSVCPEVNKYRHKQGDMVIKKMDGKEVLVPVDRFGSADGKKYPLDLAAYARAHPAQNEWDETFQEMLSRTGKEQRQVPVPVAPKRHGRFQTFGVD